MIAPGDHLEAIVRLIVKSQSTETDLIPTRYWGGIA
jgi:hypothetical protein